MERAKRSVLKYETSAKLMLMKRPPSKFAIKNFFLVVYLLYYRYTVEFGISMMTFTETAIVNAVVAFLIYAVWKQGVSLLFHTLKFLWRVFKCAYWVYCHIDEIDL